MTVFMYRSRFSLSKSENQYKGVRRLACGLKGCIHAGHGAKKRHTKTDVKGVLAEKCKTSIRGCDAGAFLKSPVFTA